MDQFEEKKEKIKKTKTAKIMDEKVEIKVEKIEKGKGGGKGGEKEEVAMVFEFTNGQIVVLDGKEAVDAKDEICREHFIPTYCSADLLHV